MKLGEKMKSKTSPQPFERLGPVGKKAPNRNKHHFVVSPDSDNLGAWCVNYVHVHKLVRVSGNFSRTKAQKVVNRLNFVMREETFTPKSHGARSRRKGHQFEREVAISLRSVFPKARRHLEYQDAEANGVDLVETENFSFQCKKLKTYASINTIKEVQCERALGDVPVLVTAADNEPWMVVLYYDDFLGLLLDRR